MIQNFRDFYSQCKSRHFYLFDVPPRFISTLMDIIWAIFSWASSSSSIRLFRFFFLSILLSILPPPFVLFLLSFSLCVYSSFFSFIFCCDVTSKENASTGLQEITRRKQKKRRDGIPLPFRQPLRSSRRSSCGEYCTSFSFHFFLFITYRVLGALRNL